MNGPSYRRRNGDVYITCRRLDVLEKATPSVTSFSGSIVPRRMDVTDDEDVKACAKYIKEIDGKLNTLVNKFIYGTLKVLASSHDPDFTAKKYAAEDPFEPKTVQNWADLFALNTIAPSCSFRRTLSVPPRQRSISGAAAKELSIDGALLLEYFDGVTVEDGVHAAHVLFNGDLFAVLAYVYWEGYGHPYHSSSRQFKQQAKGKYALE
ncbi:hypothetical protein IW262DRAFT_1302088 [Armillaria fumosa]|nr:hypothetical protein IW262DRAFT_1302088 [Armillaria fumosa]